MLGSIIGDIVGSRFVAGEKATEGFELFTDNCSITDDTICTIAVADAILHGKNYKESLLSWCRRYPEPAGGYGLSFHRWLQESNPMPVASDDNGSAMRVSPVGWLYDDYRDVLLQAKQSAECSHCHADGINGAQCVATLIYWLRTCRITKDEVESAVAKNFGYELPPLKDINRIGALGHFDSTCQETVPWAIRCFLESNSFEEAIRLAVLSQGNTNTKASIAGAIAEAYYEVPVDLAQQALKFLPKEMLDVLYLYLDTIEQTL